MNRLYRLFTASAVGVLAFSFLLSNALGQTGTAIKGHIVDAKGAAVSGAMVRLSSRNGPQDSAKTNSNGDYEFRIVPAGDYIIEVTAPGFAATASEQIHIDGATSLTRDFQLSVASVNENVVVIAAGFPQRADEVSKAVTILEESAIEDRREVSLAEALRGTPGLRVQQQGSPGTLTSLRFRGQRNFDTALLLDGLRVRDSADINGSAFPFITDLSPNNLDRVELLRGSGSSIYGTNAIGGVVNLVQKVGVGAPRFEAGFEAGGLGMFRSRLQGAGGITESSGFSFGVTRFDVRDGIDGNDAYGNTSGAARVQFALTPSIDLSGNFYGTSSNAVTNDSPQALAGAFSSTARFPRAIEGVTFQPDFDNPDQGRRNAIWAASVRFTHRLNEDVSYSLAYQKVSTRRRNYNGPDFDPRFIAFLPFGEFEFTNINNGGTDTFDARTNIRLGRSNQLTAGFEFERESLFQRFMSAFGAPEGTTDRQRTYAIFGQDQIVLLDGRLQIAIGARQQWFKIRAADRPGFLAQIDAKSSVTGDGAVAYFVERSGTKLRAHVGNGFRAASLFERFGEGTFQNGFARFGDPTLRAEQSISVDGGLDQRLANNKLIFGVTYFYTRLQRVIDFKSFRSFFNPAGDPDPLGLGRTGGYLNFPGGISRGVETYLETSPFRGTNLRAAYTYTNADRFVSGSGTLPQFVTPKHQFGLAFTQRYRHFLISLDANHTGEYIGPVFPAELTFSGYTKVDLFVSYEKALNDRVLMTFFGGAYNIFDQDYFENGFRAPGAVGRGGVKVRF